MRVFLHTLMVGPTSGLGPFGVWALVVGISLIVPNNIFLGSHAWDVLTSIYPHPSGWGWAMALNGVLLLYCLRSKVVAIQASIVLFSALCWFAMGVSMTVNAWVHSHYMSITGCYSIIMSIQATLAIERLARFGTEDGS